MMAYSSDKENPNPIIHSTEKRTRLSQTFSKALLGSDAIRRYALGSKDHLRHDNYDYVDIESSLPIVSTTEERLVAIAISEAVYPNTNSTKSTDDESSVLELLNDTSFPIFNPHQLQKALKIPSFAPSSMTKSSHASSRQRDPFTAVEVFDIIRTIQDPEHPLTLEQLNVVRLELISVVDVHPDVLNCKEEDTANGIRQFKLSTICVQFTPTIPHCSMATLIGLTLRVKLLRSLPARFKVVVKIEPGTHVSEHAVNKQLADKERVRAALENEHLLGVVNKCIARTG